MKYNNGIIKMVQDSDGILYRIGSVADVFGVPIGKYITYCAGRRIDTLAICL